MLSIHLQVVQYGSIGEEFASEKELFGSGEYVTHVSCGEHHSLFVTNHRRVFSCGDNVYGACALPEEISTVKQVTLIPQLSNCNIVETKCGCCHSFFISEGYQSVFATGFNANGECGLSMRTAKIYGVERFDGLNGTQIKYVASGAYHTVFVTVDNCVYTSGFCAFGSLGQGSRDGKSFTPRSVNHPDLGGLKLIKSVECGQWHSIVIAEDGSAYSWGYNNHGQCGLNSSLQPNVVNPTLVTGIPSDEKIADARCGKSFTLFRTMSNNFYGCGENSHGALGLPSVYIQSIVTQIPLSIGTVLDYRCGVNFTVFTTTKGKTYICGYKGMLCQLKDDTSSVAEVQMHWVSHSASYNTGHLMACSPLGDHMLLYSVPTNYYPFPSKLFTAQQKGLLCDTILVLAFE